MTTEYLITRLSKISATLTEKSKYEWIVTEQDGTEHTFPSRNAAYKHYFERKYGDEKGVVKKRKKYVR